MLLKIEHRCPSRTTATSASRSSSCACSRRPRRPRRWRASASPSGPPARVFRYRDWNDNLAHHFTVTKFHDRIEVVEPLARRDASGRRRRWRPSSSEPPRRSSRTRCTTSWSSRAGAAHARRCATSAARSHVGQGRTLGEQVAAIGDAPAPRVRLPAARDALRLDDGRLPRRRGAGVCQDFAHLALALLRLRGIPCRYVSGYLHVERTPRRAGAEPRVDRVPRAVGGLGAVRSHAQRGARRALRGRGPRPRLRRRAAEPRDLPRRREGDARRRGPHGALARPRRRRRSRKRSPRSTCPCSRKSRNGARSARRRPTRPRQKLSSSSSSSSGRESRAGRARGGPARPGSQPPVLKKASLRLAFSHVVGAPPRRPAPRPAPPASLRAELRLME